MTTYPRHPRRRLRTPSPKLRRPPACSTNSNSTATSHPAANPIRAPCPTPTGSTAPSPASSISSPAALHDTRLEPDLDDLLWRLTDLFHKKAAHVQRLLDDNEDRQKRSQAEQDGSEVRSVELEQLHRARAQDLIERRDTYELVRDLAAEHYEAETGSSWRPRAGSLVNRRTMTAAMIDSRDFISARRRADTELMLPKGPKIAFSGGTDYNDHQRIWAVLDKVLAKHPDMVLLHGGTPKGAEFIAARWADNRKVTQIAFKPDWTARRQGRALQAQRPHARDPADRRHRLPRLRHHRQSRRQGQEARHSRPRSPGGRRVSAAFSPAANLRNRRCQCTEPAQGAGGLSISTGPLCHPGLRASRLRGAPNFFPPAVGKKIGSPAARCGAPRATRP